MDAGDEAAVLLERLCWPSAAEFLLWAAAMGIVAVAALAIQYVDDVFALFWLGTLVNAGLSLVKVVLAQFSVHAKALMADAVHGLGDTLAEVVTALAYTEAARPPDREHPWGHGKIESMATVLVTLILFYIAATMGWDSAVTLFPMLTRKLHGGSKEPVDSSETTSPRQPPREGQASPHGEARSGGAIGHAAIAVSIASVLLKEALFKATLVVGERTQSNLVVATAWHHRSDSLAAGVSLVSQVGASLGQHYLDSLGGGVVASMLAHSACGNLADSVNDLLDYNPASEKGTWTRCGRDVLAQSIVEVPGVLRHSLRTRRMGPYCVADVTIAVDARITASAASVIAEAVHDHVIHDFKPFVTDVVVHVDPDGTPQSHHVLPDKEVSTAMDDLVNPEEVDAKVRAALLSFSEERPDLPRIVEITSLQAYYVIEEEEPSSTEGDAGLVDGNSIVGKQASPYVDVAVGFRLASEDATIRSARLVARAARARVLAELPDVIRDIDLSLALAEEAPLADAAESPTPTAAPGTLALADHCVGDGSGSWSADTCRPPSGHLTSSSRRLRQVTLIWDGGPDSRHTRTGRIR